MTRSRSRTYSYPFSGGRAGGSLLGAGAASAAAGEGAEGAEGGGGGGSAAGHSLSGDEVAALLLSAFFCPV